MNNHSKNLSASIDPTQCIGCARCLQECPYDAILGSRNFLHTVLSPLCTGCEACVSVCPMECISLKEKVPLELFPLHSSSEERKLKRETRLSKQLQKKALPISPLLYPAQDATSKEVSIQERLMLSLKKVQEKDKLFK